MSKIYVVPTRGAPLPYPAGELPIAGGYVDTADHFWRRRLTDQDVAPATPPAEAEPEEPAAPAEPAAGADDATAEPASRRRQK